MDKEKSIKRGERLIDSHTIEKYVYFIEEGTCYISFPDEAEDKIVGFGYPHTFLFSPSILTGKRSDQDVVAIKQLKVRAIHKDVFFEFVQSSRETERMWTKQIESLLTAQIDRQIDLLIDSPKRRYERLLERSPHVFQFIPKKYIAQYLRMTPETLSRLGKS